MESRIKKFKDLTIEELYQLLKLRQDVFIIEQNCPYPDLDGVDDKADHLLIYSGESLIAYSRIFAPGIKFEDSSSIGRIVVNPAHRGKTFGVDLINQSIDICKQKYSRSPIRIEAQAALNTYYQQFGFIPEGDVYLVDDIEHQQMVIELNS